jgi:transposase
VAHNFIACDRDQQFLLPPSLNDWLPQGHLARFIASVVEQLDLAEFYKRRRNDGWGRPAFDPKMMVALLLYAYCTGVRSSSQIERKCPEDIAFRFVAANEAPDHATIARSRNVLGDPDCAAHSLPDKSCRQDSGNDKVGVAELARRDRAAEDVAEDDKKQQTLHRVCPEQSRRAKNLQQALLGDHHGTRN